MYDCPSCKQPLGDAQAAKFCPHCGFSIAGLDARPGWIRSNIDLRAVASGQRAILWLLLVQILAYVFVAMVMHQRGPLPAILAGIVYLSALIATTVAATRLMVATRTHPILIVIATLFLLAPCASLLILMLINSHATSILRAAGLYVGLMGVPDSALRIALSTNTCWNCGYSMTGNMTGICPECGAKPKFAGAGNS